MPRLLLAVTLLALPLGACRKAPEENVEAKAERTSRALEDGYNRLQAEAENDAATAAAPYDNEADALLNQMAGNAAAPANAARSAAPSPPGAGVR